MHTGNQPKFSRWGINTMNAIEVAQNNLNSWNRHDADVLVAATSWFLEIIARPDAPVIPFTL
jgi:hypothetical protein